MPKKNSAKKEIFIISKIKKDKQNILNSDKNILPNQEKNMNDSEKKSNVYISKNSNSKKMSIDSDIQDSLQNSIVINEKEPKKLNIGNDSFYNIDNSFGDNVSTANSNIEIEKKKENNSLIMNKEYNEEPKKSESNHSIEMNKENEINFNNDPNNINEMEYIGEIFENLRIEEENNKYKIDPDYFKKQGEINRKMRIILIDWILEVSDKLKFTEETFFTTIYIIDAYLSKKFIKRKNFQLLGVSALFISIKLKEYYAGNIKDYVFITNYAYDEKDILSMEKDICRTLNFNFLVPTCLSFFQILSKKIGIDDDSNESKFGIFLIKNFLMSSNSFNYKYSTIASSACFLITKIFEIEKNINFGMSGDESTTFIEDCTKSIIKNMSEIFNCNMNISVKKYYYGLFNNNILKLLSMYNN